MVAWYNTPMTNNTPRVPRDARRSSDFSNSNPQRDAILENLRQNPNTWAEISQHASTKSAQQIKRRLKRANTDFEFRVQADEDGGGTIFALYPDAYDEDGAQ